MRVAVLSDVHGNLPALEAVLPELDAADVDAVVLTGDIAAGPLPVETLDRLTSLPWPMYWVRGNADRQMVEAYDAGPHKSEEDPWGDRWAGLQLRPDQRDLLAGLPLTLSLEIDGLGPVLFFHGTPRRDAEILLVDSPFEFFAEVLAGVAEEVVVCGNTHMPYDRLAGGHRVINPGSVGMAYAPPGAYWAVLGPTVELRRTRFDAEAAAAAIVERSTWPKAAEWVQEYVVSPYGADEALAAFAEMSAAERGAAAEHPEELGG